MFCFVGAFWLKRFNILFEILGQKLLYQISISVNVRHGGLLGRGLENYLAVKQITRYVSSDPWGWYPKPSKLWSFYLQVPISTARCLWIFFFSEYSPTVWYIIYIVTVTLQNATPYIHPEQKGIHLCLMLTFVRSSSRNSQMRSTAWRVQWLK